MALDLAWDALRDAVHTVAGYEGTCRSGTESGRRKPLAQRGDRASEFRVRATFDTPDKAIGSTRWTVPIKHVMVLDQPAHITDGPALDLYINDRVNEVRTALLAVANWGAPASTIISVKADGGAVAVPIVPEGRERPSRYQVETPYILLHGSC